MRNVAAWEDIYIWDLEVERKMAAAATAVVVPDRGLQEAKNASNDTSPDDRRKKTAATRDT